MLKLSPLRRLEVCGPGIMHATPEHVAAMLVEQGVTQADVAAAIDTTDPLSWRIDRSHLDWRRKLCRVPRPARPTPSARATPVASADRWGELHRRSYTPVTNKTAELRWITALADGMTRPCNCRRHWREYLAAHPPAIDTPELYEAWAVAAHNAVNVRLKRPTLTVEQSRAVHPPPRPKHRFAYFTGSNRVDEGPRIAAMIASARRAGVTEDFHAFAVSDVAGAINRRIKASRPWKNHMAKVDLLSDLAKLTGGQYDFFVWLDSDNWFVRDPGDLSGLLRDEPIWVGMEARLNDSVHGDWYGMRTNETPNLVDIMIQGGCNPACVRGTNGGMWIVRREAVAEFHRRMFAAADYFARLGYRDATNDEPALSIVGSTMVRDPERNTNFGDVWACDWVGRFEHRLPDRGAWAYKDWGTQADAGMINPAIVHLMRGKHLMTTV